MSDFKIFDWQQCAEQHCAASTVYLRENHDKPITEEQFIADYKALEHDHARHGKHTPSALSKQYQHLRTEFGFFPDEPEPEADDGKE